MWTINFNLVSFIFSFLDNHYLRCFTNNISVLPQFLMCSDVSSLEWETMLYQIRWFLWIQYTGRPASLVLEYSFKSTHLSKWIFWNVGWEVACRLISSDVRSSDVMSLLTGERTLRGLALDHLPTCSILCPRFTLFIIFTQIPYSRT